MDSTSGTPKVLLKKDNKGDIYLQDYKKPRSASLIAHLSGLAAGTAGSVISIFARDTAADFFKEDAQKYEILEDDTLSQGLKKDFSRLFDLKLWKSSSVEVVGIAASIILGRTIQKKMEEKKFVDQFGEVPSGLTEKEQVAFLFPQREHQASPTNSWQEKLNTASASTELQR